MGANVITPGNNAVEGHRERADPPGGIMPRRCRVQRAWYRSLSTAVTVTFETLTFLAMSRAILSPVRPSCMGYRFTRCHNAGWQAKRASDATCNSLCHADKLISLEAVRAKERAAAAVTLPGTGEPGIRGLVDWLIRKRKPPQASSCHVLFVGDSVMKQLFSAARCGLEGHGGGAAVQVIMPWPRFFFPRYRGTRG